MKLIAYAVSTFILGVLTSTFAGTVLGMFIGFAAFGSLIMLLITINEGK